MSAHALPPRFIWGAATAAAQIEGAAHEDGKEASIWDRFARVPGAIVGGDTPEVAADHYHRMPADVAIMKELGLDAYRFSTSWARVKPGDRRINGAGFDFYSRLVDTLLDAGIEPWLTLYHWDLPQALEDGQGGWAARDTAYRFADYAGAVYDRLGDRVERWTTFNEPLCATLVGYAAGDHAPGRTNPRLALAAVHHMHLAHGLAVQALRGAGARYVGTSLNLNEISPADPADPVDIDAARRIDGLQNRLFLEPLLLGAYPADVLDDVRGLGLVDNIRDGDLETISQPLDFLGINWYNDSVVTGHNPSFTGAPSLWVGSEHVRSVPRGLPTTALDWEINPDALRILLVRLTAQYPTLPPLYITENGAAFDDVVQPDGGVDDVLRSEYLREHIAAVRAAIAQGADVRGYFAWSLIDNFEWAEGYGPRFGLVRVDYDTLERTVKSSGRDYSRLILDSRAPIRG